MADQQESIRQAGVLERLLTEADELAPDPATRQQAHEIWRGIIDDYLHNDFLQMQVQRAETGLVTFPKTKSEPPPVPDSEEQSTGLEGGEPDSGEDKTTAKKIDDSTSRDSA